MAQWLTPEQTITYALKWAQMCIDDWVGEGADLPEIFDEVEMNWDDVDAICNLAHKAVATLPQDVLVKTLRDG